MNENNMNNKAENTRGLKALLSSTGHKKGTYGAGLTVVIIAIAVVLSLMTGLLPEDLKAIDISDNKVYTIGETTEELLASLENNLSFTVIAEPDTMDSRIERLIKQYTSRSDKIALTEIDPVKSPAEVTALGGAANTIIVTNDDNGKTTTVSFDDILIVDPYSSYYYGTSDATEFDGEGQLTGAVHYVTSENTSRIYLTNGHGESALPASITERLTKLSLPTDSLSLLMSGGVPEDCSLLIVFAPASDISQDEKTVLSKYLARGGAMMYVAGYEAVRLPVFESLLAEYGITFVEGYIADVERYYQDSPYNIFPVLNDVHDITKDFGADELVLLIQSQGFELTSPARDTVTVESFMTTSEGGIAVTEASQTEGQYVLGATAIEPVGDENAETRIVAIASASVVEEQILSSFPSLVNADVFINAVTYFIDDVANISIPSKSLAITYNTVTGGAVWRALFVFIIPAALIAGGLFVWLRRRRA